MATISYVVFVVSISWRVHFFANGYTVIEDSWIAFVVVPRSLQGYLSLFKLCYALLGKLFTHPTSAFGPPENLNCSLANLHPFQT